MSRRGVSTPFGMILLISLFLLLEGTLSLAIDRFTPQEKRGREIYLKGTSPSGGEITALFGKADLQVPASVMPCVNCHGRDGRGRPEGGVTPSNLTWSALSKPYGVQHSGGRKHPPYTERLIKRAITMGLDPAGNELYVAMPRYRLSHQDIADLIAYIKSLGTKLGPGLSKDSIIIGTVLPFEGELASLGEAIQALLQAYFQEINQKGGIYNRRIELRVTPLAQGQPLQPEALQELIQADHVFALIGPTLPGERAETFASILQELEMPLVSPFALSSQSGSLVNPFVFHLLSGLEEQGRALVKFAARSVDAAAARAAVVYPLEGGFENTVEAIQQEAADLGWSQFISTAYRQEEFNPDALAEQMKEENIDFLFLLGFEEQLAFLRSAEHLGWYPRVYLPGFLVRRGIFQVPAGFEGRIYSAFPSLPSDQTPSGSREYQELASKYKLPSYHQAAQILSLGSAHVLVEGLQRAGRELTRHHLVEELEGLYRFETGLTQPVSYGPNRRIGVLGAHVVSIDLEHRSFVPAGDWLSLAP